MYPNGQYYNIILNASYIHSSIAIILKSTGSGETPVNLILLRAFDDCQFYVVPKRRLSFCYLTDEKER